MSSFLPFLLSWLALAGALLLRPDCYLHQLLSAVWHRLWHGG